MKKRARSSSLGDKPKPTPTLVDLLKKPQTFVAVGINNEWAFQPIRLLGDLPPLVKVKYLDLSGNFLHIQEIESTELSVRQVFDSWAQVGKDEEFEASNRSCKTFLTTVLPIPQTEFSLLELGCANGWLLRWFFKRYPLARLTGVDVSPKMIKKAYSRVDESVRLVCSDFLSFKPDHAFDLIFCMSSLYYVVPMETFPIAKLCKPGSLFVCGTDCFLENEVCHSWPSMLNLSMDIRSASSWKSLFVESYQLKNVEQKIIPNERFASGTLFTWGYL